MNLNFENLINEALPAAGFGMIGIFAVTAVIILCIALVNWGTAKLEDRKNKEDK